MLVLQRPGLAQIGAAGAGRGPTVAAAAAGAGMQQAQGSTAAPGGGMQAQNRTAAAGAGTLAGGSKALAGVGMQAQGRATAGPVGRAGRNGVLGVVQAAAAWGMELLEQERQQSMAAAARGMVAGEEGPLAGLTGPTGVNMVVAWQHSTAHPTTVSGGCLWVMLLMTWCTYWHNRAVQC
jgi:hypothetical protein